jgi:glycosyltransferase involved in cell wall biosynthesis
MGPLRVVTVINGLGTGGAERSLADLLPKLRDRGVDVEVVCSYSRDEGVESQLRDDGFKITHLRSRWFIGRLLELRRLLHERRPQLVHTMIIESDLLGRLAAAGTGIPVLTSLVNTSYDPARLGDANVSRWKLETIRSVDGITARKLTAGFHALSEAVAQNAERALGVPHDRITIIGRTRDPKRLGELSTTRRRAVREGLGLSEDDQLILTAGRQEYQKGHIVLVDAVAIMAASHPRLRVLLVGRSGSYTEAINARVEYHGLEGVIQSLGHRTDLPHLLSAADIFAFPSLYEGFGGSLLEAMYLGVPAVVSDLSALREVGGDCVQFVPAGEPALWATAIAEFLDDEDLRKELASCAYSRARQHFDIDLIADCYANWYRKMNGAVQPNETMIVEDPAHTPHDRTDGVGDNNPFHGG